jgi:hypothetical protein
MRAGTTHVDFDRGQCDGSAQQPCILELMADDTKQKAQHLIDRLRESGHQAEADQLARHLKAQAVERGLLFVLRETCETLLTAIEAIDPVTQTMIEELRLDVEKRLRLHDDHQETG